MVKAEIITFWEFTDMIRDDYDVVYELANKLDALQDKLSTMVKNTTGDSDIDFHEYLMSLTVWSRNEIVVGGHVLEGDATIIPFFGLYLETKSGYIVSDKTEKPIVYGNLFSRLRFLHGVDKFDSDVFIARLEQYYLGEIEDLKDVFNYTVKVTDTKSLETKSKLYNLLCNKDLVESSKFDFNGMMEYLNELYKVHSLFKRIVASGMPAIQEDYQEGRFQLMTDLDTFSRYMYSLENDNVEEFYSNYDTNSQNHSDMLDVVTDDLFNQEIVVNEGKTKLSKSENRYLRMLPLIEASEDDEMKCYASLLGEKEEIISSIKSSKFKDVIKGAFLKGVITKKDSILSRVANFKLTDKMQSISFKMQKGFLALLKYYKVFDSKIVKRVL